MTRTFAIDVLRCAKSDGRMQLAIVTRAESITRYLSNIGEPTCVPARSQSRGPAYWKGTVLGKRRRATTDRSTASISHRLLTATRRQGDDPLWGSQHPDLSPRVA